MKKLISISSIVLLLIVLFAAQVNMSSCTKTNTAVVRDTVTVPPPYPIQGLWIGTYTTATPATLYLSYTIYPDGTFTYKGPDETGYTFFASGTWALTGTAFSFTDTVVNQPTGTPHIQNGAATFNSLNGTLTNGTISDLTDGNHYTFSLSWHN